MIAYLVFQPFWRSGFASEAVSATVDHVFFNHGDSSFEAFVDTRNVASQNLLGKLVVHCLEKIDAADYFKGHSSDEFRYCLLRKMWV